MAVYADNYSRLVISLKVVLPLIGLAILSTLFLASKTIDPSQATRLVDVDVEKLVSEQRVGALNYSGVSDNGVAFSISAGSAVPTNGDYAVISADNVAAIIETKSGTLIDIIAEAGLIDRDSKQATLSGGVTIDISLGYHITTGVLLSTFDISKMESKTEIKATGPFGDLVAGKMVLTQQSQPGEESDYLLVFTNGVNLIYNPQK